MSSPDSPGAGDLRFTGSDEGPSSPDTDAPSASMDARDGPTEPIDEQEGGCGDACDATCSPRACKKPVGHTCDSNEECDSTYCTDWICCQQACGAP